MILAMPISSWATVMMTTHCQTPDNILHSMSTHLDGNESIHMHDQIPSPDSNNQSNCECDDNMNCSVSGCNATALLNGTAIDLSYSTHFVYQRVQSLADPTDSDLLFRPPI